MTSIRFAFTYEYSRSDSLPDLLQRQAIEENIRYDVWRASEGEPWVATELQSRCYIKDERWYAEVTGDLYLTVPDKIPAHEALRQLRNKSSWCFGKTLENSFTLIR